MKDTIVIHYKEEWPQIFKSEAEKIKAALGDNSLAVHHIGSTAVPGLTAKPIIDMIAVVQDAAKAIHPLEDLGFEYKGECDIPMRFYFNRSDINLHVYEEGHPEIELNLTFRDYLRGHQKAREEYAELKANHLGKDGFIRKILKETPFQRVRIMRCTHKAEWEAAQKMRQKYFFDPLSMQDPYIWTFEHPEHSHLVLYKGADIIGYVHIQFWPEHRAALRIIVVEESLRGNGLGSQFLQLCEQWLKNRVLPLCMMRRDLTLLPFIEKMGT